MNFCYKCGSTITPDSNVCPNCGEPVMNAQQPQMAVSPDMTNVQVAQPMSQVIPAEQQAPVPFEASAPVPMAPQAPAPIEASAPVPMVPQAPAPIEASAPVPMAPQAPMATVQPEAPAAPDTPGSESPKKQKKEKPKKEKQKKVRDEESDKKFNRSTTIIVVLISLASIVLMVFFMYKALFMKEEVEDNTIKNATQYNYEGFEFFLPEGIVASVEDGLFVVKGVDSSWGAIITIQEGSYNTLVSNKSQISGYFENLGYVSGEAKEEEVSGMGFVTTEVLIGNKNVLVAYAKASGTKVYGILYFNELYTYDNVSLKTVGEILASAIYSGEITSMPSGFTIEMFEETFEASR